MIEIFPQSRDALFQLLRELAGAGTPTPEQLVAVREGIAQGHLGAPDDALVEDGGGARVPLVVWAARWRDAELVKLLLQLGADLDAGNEGDTALHSAAAAGDVAMVELLLARGASPLAVRADRQSVLRAAHGSPPVAHLVRRAAREAIERGGGARPGLATPAFERRYALRADRGVRELRRALERRGQLDVLLVRADLKTTVRAFAGLVQAPRREADVASRPVADARRAVFLYRLRGIDWTIVPFVFEPASPWNIEHLGEMAGPGVGIARVARALASAIAGRVIHVKHTEHSIHDEHGAIETSTSDEELARLGVLVPPMAVATDGYHVELQLFGIDPADVERVDMVAVQEHGDRDVDRATQTPVAAPPLVGVLAMPGVPALVRPPPEPNEEPRPSAPPMMREPPPMVVAPTPKEPPPIVREPPPVAALDPIDAPLVHEPPRVAASDPPPLVREPPPRVAATEPPPFVRDAPAVVALPPETPGEDDA